MKKILVAEKMAEIGIQILKEKGFEVVIGWDLNRDEILNVIEKFDAILVRSSTQIDKELLEKAKNLKIIARAGNGIDNIDVKEATKKGVVVANTPDSNSISACELTIGLIMAQARNIPQANQFLKSKNWDRKRFLGVELFGKTLGIIGLGRIGSLVAKRMKSFGMQVIAFDPYIKDEKFEELQVKKIETLSELLKVSDFITVHTPKTTETNAMIAEDEIEMMKDGVCITNVARGGIIKEKALLEAIKNGKIKSAALDVHEKEPCFNELFNCENVIVTPHMGASTKEAQDSVGIAIANQVISALNSQIVQNAVNLPTLNRTELDEVKPYIELMENMGKIVYQYQEDAIELIDIKYWGEIAKKDVQMATLGFIKGLLETVLKESVNYINAKMLLNERGISLRERKDINIFQNYLEIITIRIKTNKGEFQMAGNLSGKNEPKLVQIQGYELDVAFGSDMVFIRNKDVPGVVGSIGKILGEENVNIATMQLGRNKEEGEALMVLNVDNKVSNNTLKNLESKCEAIFKAKFIEI